MKACAHKINGVVCRYERDHFTVVIQPAFTNLNLFYTQTSPTSPPRIDYSYFAPDCLHPSQKLHALMARALWNNILQPVGEKTTGWSPDPPLLCPSPDSPYLSTRLNSGAVNMSSRTWDYQNYMNTVTQHRIGCHM